jgi:hypothetical protein
MVVPVFPAIIRVPRRLPVYVVIPVETRNSVDDQNLNGCSGLEKSNSLLQAKRVEFLSTQKREFRRAVPFPAKRKGAHKGRLSVSRNSRMA